MLRRRAVGVQKQSAGRFPSCCRVCVLEGREKGARRDLSVLVLLRAKAHPTLWKVICLTWKPIDIHTNFIQKTPAQKHPNLPPHIWVLWPNQADT